MIYLLRSKPTQQQLSEMLETLGSYIKLAVDIRKRILAGGGELHADCEAVLIENDCRQEDVWGADWIPYSKHVTFESLINIRPTHNNFALEVEDPVLRERIESVVREIFES